MVLKWFGFSTNIHADIVHHKVLQLENLEDLINEEKKNLVKDLMQFFFPNKKKTTNFKP